jgi:hypothetical protein
MNFRIVIFYLLLFIVSLSHAQPTIQAIKIKGPPVIDGIVNDEVWNQAFMVDEFYQREPNTGAPISERTEFYICYDVQNIYFAVKCWDDPQKISAKEMARDANLGNDDRIKILLDTYLDRRTGYYFSINPLGGKYDLLISDNGASINRDWNGLWIGKARITDYGWEAEIAIPVLTLGFNKEKNTWGIKLVREMEHKIEAGYWPVANINNQANQLSDAGLLIGLEGLSQGFGLEISPYLTTGFNKQDGNGSNNNFDLAAGMDISYQISSGLKTTVSFNTDFAETEVDDRQINLTRFSLHYPEKRHFFLDGASYFQFGNEGDRNSPVDKDLIVFFSRRMGLDALGMPIPVNYAAKFTGKVNNWNFGIIHLNDARKSGINNFYVARVNRNFWQESSLGIISTYGNTLSNDQNLLTGFDIKLGTSSFKKNKNITLILYGLKSFTQNSPNNKNSSYGIQFIYPNDFIDGRLGYYEIEKNFFAGMGFIPRSNIRKYFGEVDFGPRLNKYGILQVEFGGKYSHVSNNETGLLETREFEFKPLGIRFLSGDEISYSRIYHYEWLHEDFNIFEDRIISKDEYSWWNHEIKIETKGARRLWGELSYGFGQFYNGKRQNFEVKANWKLGIPFLLGCTVNRNIIKIPTGNFTANVYQFNVNILFNPDLTLYNYFQYDNGTNNVGWQSRFQWIVKPGNELILVWNSHFIRPENNFLLDENSLRLKLKYNIRF